MFTKCKICEALDLELIVKKGSRKNKVQNVVAMASRGDIVDVAGNVMLPILNYVNDLAKQHVDAATISVKLMVLQLVAGR